MKKFIGLFIKGKPHIFECEVSLVSPKPSSLKEEENLFKVLAPSKLKGELYYSFFFQDSLDESKEKMIALISDGLLRDSRKLNIEFSDEDLKSQINSIVIEVL